MLEHVLCRATLHMGKPAMMLLLLTALCVVSVSARPSLRPSSPEEFRKLLLWAQKAAENGEVQSAYPSAEQLNEVDKIWIKNHKKGYQQDVDLIGPSYKSYVESSAFRRHHKTSTEPPSTQSTVGSLSNEPSPTEAVPVVHPVPSSIPVDKRIFTKKVDQTRSKPISEVLSYYSDDGPDAEKKPETLSQTAIIYVKNSGDTETLPDKLDITGNQKIHTSQEVVADSLAEAASISRDSIPLRATGEEDAVPEKKTNDEDIVESRHIPPVWGPPVFSDDVYGSSISRLPSYEEYDRNERYSHSILHGFTGF